MSQVSPTKEKEDVVIEVPEESDGEDEVVEQKSSKNELERKESSNEMRLVAYDDSGSEIGSGSEVEPKTSPAEDGAGSQDEESAKSSKKPNEQRKKKKKHWLDIILSIIAWLISFALVLLLPVCMMVIGAAFIEDWHCPSEPIAVTLLIGGIFSVLSWFLSLVLWLYMDSSLVGSIHDVEVTESIKKAQLYYQLLQFIRVGFFIFWLITLTIITFRLYPRHTPTNRNDPNFCHATLFDCAYWACIIYIILASIYFILLIIILCVLAFSPRGQLRTL